ncbi:MAG: site-specific integrase [Planctomycetota bacterium]|nr:site-specific integrase [Planctomycetota bacterium]
MARKKEPKYCRQTGKSGGDRAYVKLNGLRHYLGKYGSPESKEKYHRLLAEWNANGRRLPAPAAKVTVVELAAAFWDHAESHYRRRDGTPTGTADNFRPILRLLKKHYAETLVADFGPRQLKSLRQRLVECGNARTYVNDNMRRLRQVFRWGVSEELVPPEVLERLRSVTPLKEGRTDARETKRVTSVSDEHVEAVRPFVSRQVWTLIELQRLTAARSGELVIMRPCDLDRSDEVWTYTPASHKTGYRGHRRTIYLGPRAQEVVKPFLDGRPDTAYLFSPREAMEDHRCLRHLERKTPLSCGNRPGSNREERPRKTPGEHYTSGTFGQAVADACKKAGVPHWHPHQIRHLAKNALEKKYGIEVARIILGHKTLNTTILYGEVEEEKAKQVVARIG